jgi:hypothetical protein
MMMMDRNGSTCAKVFVRSKRKHGESQALTHELREVSTSSTPAYVANIVPQAIST